MRWLLERLNVNPLREFGAAASRCFAAGALGLSTLGGVAYAETGAAAAVEESHQGSLKIPLIQNRFFLKTARFEIAPLAGVAPSDAYSQTFLAGADLAYHFSEGIAADTLVVYSPELGDAGVKSLTDTLINIAGESDSSNWQQPMDKISLAAVFSARLSPVYGKINLVGEGVVNFDFYGTVGAGMLGIRKNYATVGDDGLAAFNPGPFKANPSLGLGFGGNFFINQSIALKLDVRWLGYVDAPPYYGVGDQEEGLRLNTMLFTHVGLGFFIPKMQSRLFNF